MVEIKYWDSHIPPIEEQAKRQLENLASLPFIHKHVAVMPDCHAGKGCTVGTVVATKGAIIPACVGVDIGCGMIAQQTNLKASDLPDNLFGIRMAIEAAVPVGNSRHHTVPDSVAQAWEAHAIPHFWRYKHIAGNTDPAAQLGTLGGGNHFVELCLDENQNVWVMLHSGSRGIGNKIGTHFISLAQKEMERFFIHLPDRDLSYLVEGTEHFDAYVAAVKWSQEYASLNRDLMFLAVFNVLCDFFPDVKVSSQQAINCHHNYISEERHFGHNVLVTRKGAVRASKGMLGIIPGSMGAKSYIVRGLGNRDSFESCSHGAGRVMSRSQAKKTITLDDHVAATQGVECRKDSGVIDESPAAYKDLDQVMSSQSDLVEIVHTLKAILCVKG